MVRVLHRTAWVLVTIGAVLMFLLAARYFFLDLDAAAADPDTGFLRELYSGNSTQGTLLRELYSGNSISRGRWHSTFTPLP
jgi:hypothetical protein